MFPKIWRNSLIPIPQYAKQTNTLPVRITPTCGEIGYCSSDNVVKLPQTTERTQKSDGSVKSLFNEKIQITKFLPKNFCRDYQQISMSLFKIGQNKRKKFLVKI